MVVFSRNFHTIPPYHNPLWFLDLMLRSRSRRCWKAQTRTGTETRWRTEVRCCGSAGTGSRIFPCSNWWWFGGKLQLLNFIHIINWYWWIWMGHLVINYYDQLTDIAIQYIHWWTWMDDPPVHPIVAGSHILFDPFCICGVATISHTTRLELHEFTLTCSEAPWMSAPESAYSTLSWYLEYDSWMIPIPMALWIPMVS